MQYKGEKYYSLMNVVRTTTSTTYTHTEDRNPLWHYLAADYDGVDGFYLSGVLRAISGDTSYLILSTVGGTDVTSSEISTTSTVNVVIRSGDILADLTDATDYRARWKKSGTAGTSAFDRAMVVCAQTNPTKLVTVIELAEDNNVPSTSYAAPSDYAIYLHTAARFDGTVVYYLEVDLHPNSSGDNVYGALYDITGAAQVSSSEVSHTGNTTTTRKISSAITLVDGREYRPDIKGDSTSDDVNGVKLIIKQTGTPTKTDNYIGILNTASSGTGASYAYQNRLYEWDDTAWEGDSVVAKYEPTLKSSSGELAYYNLYNDTDAAELAVASTTSATYVRVRDDTVTMPSDDNNILNSGRKIDTSGTVSVARAFLIIQIDWSSGSNYTKNLSDTINTSSSIIRAVTKLISLNLNLAVVLQKATSTERSSTLNTTSSVLRLPGKLFSNPLNLSSVFARVSTLLRTLTESLNISSGLQKAISSTKSEGVNLESQLTQVDIVGKFFVETVNMSSSLIKSVSRALQEAVNLASMTIKSASKVFSSSFSLVSSILRAITKTISNTLNISEIFQKAIEGAVPEGIIFIWPGTNASIPDGYVRETTLDGLFIKGAANGADANDTGGNATHTHSATADHGHSMAAHTHTIDITGITGNESNKADDVRNSATDHTNHASEPYTSGAVVGGALSTISSSYSSVSNDPPYHEVIFIRSLGTHRIPDDAIALSDGIVPSGWVDCDGASSTPNLHDKYPKGAATSGDAGGIGGSTNNAHNLTHTHTVASHTHAAITSGASNGFSQKSVGGSGYVDHAHTHSISLDATTVSISGDAPALTTTEVVEPAYTKLLAVQNQTGDYDLVAGITALWLGNLLDIPSGWIICDGNSNTVDMRSRYLKIGTAAQVGDTGGSNTHTHSSNTHTHVVSGTHTHTASGLGHVSAVNRTGSANSATPASATHSATISSTAAVYDNATTSADSQSNEPPYRTVIFIEKTFTTLILTDTINAVSSLIRSVTKVFSSPINTLSTLIRSSTKTLLDTANLESVFAKIYQQGILMIESMNLSSNITLVRTFVRTLTDAINTTSALLRAVSKTFSDSLIKSSVLALLGAVSKTLTLIYNIFAFVLGFRSKPTILSSKRDAPTLLSAKKTGPTIVGSEPFRPTVISSKRQ